MTNPFAKCSFMKSVANISDLPPDRGVEIAFAGRSNAGKSSAINAITHNSQLAKTSKTPGRTQTINLFRIDENRRLVDLPGYGYAKVPPEVKKRWDRTLNEYLQTRESLKGICLIMDIRHPLQHYDQHMIAWADEAKLPMHILLSKADKLSKGAGLSIIADIKKKLADYPTCTCQLFSSVSGEGVLMARKFFLSWLT